MYTLFRTQGPLHSCSIQWPISRWIFVSRFIMVFSSTFHLFQYRIFGDKQNNAFTRLMSLASKHNKALHGTQSTKPYQEKSSTDPVLSWSNALWGKGCWSHLPAQWHQNPRDFKIIRKRLFVQLHSATISEVDEDDKACFNRSDCLPHKIHWVTFQQKYLAYIKRCLQNSVANKELPTHSLLHE